MKKRTFIAAVAILLFQFPGLQHAVAARFPGKHWQAYSKPEEAGFSAEKLAAARAYYDSTDAAALFVVYKGAVVANWGQTARRYMCHSARKSLMSGMYGIYVDNGTIDTSLTLQQLGIDESPTPLTAEEKKARIADLLAARSGIYLPAAYEPAQNPKPPRGKFAPGTNWCYNNWDFNTLLTIFEQITRKKFFEDFERQFAKPIGMQDYHVYDGYYHFEREKSMHAAYPFRLSARDMARFGLLYLNRGLWNGKRILSEKWVAQSTSRISEGTWTGAYGYLWWQYDAEPFKSLGMYSALGVGEQTIHVIPGADLVVVVRTDTYAEDNVDRSQHMKLVKLFLDAMTGTLSDNPCLVDIPDPDPVYKTVPMTTGEMTSYVKEYPVGRTGWTVKVTRDGNQLMIDEGEGTFPLEKIGPDHFTAADMLQQVYFEPDSAGTGRQLIFLNGLVAQAYQCASEGKHDDAFKILRNGEKYFSSEPSYFQFWGDMCFEKAQSDIDSATAKYARFQSLDSTARLDQTGLGWWLPQAFSRMYPPESSEAQLKRFTGKFGPRIIALDSGALYVSREGRPERTRIKRLSESVFGVDGRDIVHLRFHFDESGGVDKVSATYQDGRHDESMKEQ